MSVFVFVCVTQLLSDSGVHPFSGPGWPETPGTLVFPLGFQVIEPWPAATWVLQIQTGLHATW